ncbi:helix-turn-helix domain-containing protein [Streptomyces paludis]|uniref:Helix-turn-helix domain-containing protein n=1 Tax=Streptomyces paludis TaxID=2282738 RepID=A0A345HU80_9ACTN|nr:helix-turn-helix domain-containing protein [Streptomyces paludis]AXG80254.1 helix-turn-helix domain-containing protein [Streptomyces paludis]
MIGTVFRSEDVPVEDRFDYWRELTNRTVAPCDLSSDYAADFWAEQRLIELGPVKVWPASFVSARFRRTPKLVRQSDPDEYHLSLILGGEMGLDHVGRTDTYGPRDLWISDTSKPCEVGPSDDQDRMVITGVGVEFPKTLLSASPDRVRPLLGKHLPGREGAGALLTGFLTGLNREADALQPSVAPRLGDILADLLAAWFAEMLGTEADLPPETRQRALTEGIRAFIRRNLRDPALTPPVIAAAHHISVSYLHRLFQAEGVTVAAAIRHQRLERARHDLADPALCTVPVYEIAAGWGFTHPSVFSRAFRAAYGIPPADYRHHAHAQGRVQDHAQAPPLAA